MKRSPLAAWFAAWLLAALVPTAVVAQEPYPAKPIKFLVPFPPGGAADTFARVVSQKLNESWGKPVVVENRPGAGGIIATEVAAKSAPDGYTFLFVTVGHAVNPSIYSKLPYSTEADFAPVAWVASVPNLLVVNPSVPAKSVAELIALARSQPGKMTYASSGNATTSHLAAALFTSMAKIDMVHVPYKGAAPAVSDLIAGQVQVMLDPVISSGPHVKSGKLRALAVTTAKRSPLVPDLPTLAEAGLPGYEFSAWFAMLAPAKTPREIVEKVNKEVARILTAPDVKERYAALGAEAGSGSPAEVGAFLKSESQRWAKVVKDANIRVE